MTRAIDSTAIFEDKRVVITKIIAPEDAEYENLYEVWSPETNTFTQADDTDLADD